MFRIFSCSLACAASQPLNVNCGGMAMASSMEKPAESSELLPSLNLDQAAIRSSDYAAVETVTKSRETSKSPVVNRSAEVIKEPASRLPATSVAADPVKTVPAKSTGASQLIDTISEAPAKLVNFGRTVETSAGQRKNVGEAGKPVTNVSIHFSKKALFEDSDEDEGMGIAISVTSLPSKEAAASEKRFVYWKLEYL